MRLITSSFSPCAIIWSALQSGNVTESEYLKRLRISRLNCSCDRSSSAPIFCLGVASKTYASRLIGVTAAEEFTPLMMLFPSSSTTAASHAGRSPFSATDSRQSGLKRSSKRSSSIGSPIFTCTRPKFSRKDLMERIKPNNDSFSFAAPPSSLINEAPSISFSYPKYTGTKTIGRLGA